MRYLQERAVINQSARNRLFSNLSGIGGKLTTNTVGVFNGTSEVFFHLEAIANILSQSQEHDEGASVVYLNEQEQYTVQHEGRDTLLFERVGGLYCFDASNPKLIANNTVNDNKLECMRYFFTVTVMLKLSVIFVTLIFVYAVNYCLIENSFDGHV